MDSDLIFKDLLKYRVTSHICASCRPVFCASAGQEGISRGEVFSTDNLHQIQPLSCSLCCIIWESHKRFLENRRKPNQNLIPLNISYGVLGPSILGDQLPYTIIYLEVNYSSATSNFIDLALVPRESKKIYIVPAPPAAPLTFQYR